MTAVRQDGRGLRMVFAGTPQFAVPSLEALIGAGIRPLAVLSQPDRPAGRGRKVMASPVKRCALAHGLPVLQPVTLRQDGVREELKSLDADLMVVAAYGLILPRNILELPRHGCWNIHASLLPRWRGAAPIPRAIEAGDRSTGVCIMQMEAELDTGPVYHCLETPIHDHDTGGSLHDRLAAMGASALLHCLGQLRDGTLPEPAAQAQDGVCYARKLDRSEARIDWTRTAGEIERQVRAYNPWPVAWCELHGERVKVWQARAVSMECRGSPGEIEDSPRDHIHICTGDGRLSLLEVQRPGGRRITVSEYLRARPAAPPA